MDQHSDHLAIAPGNTWLLPKRLRLALVEEPQSCYPALLSILCLKELKQPYY